MGRIHLSSYGISNRCLSWYRCAFPSCSRTKIVICVCASTVKKPLSQAGRGMNFAARGARTSLMSTNLGKRKRRTKQITAKKCLRHLGDCGILNIKKGICVNRCPTGATDRRLARLVNYEIAVSFDRGRLFLCLVTILTDRVSYSKAGQAETQHCNQS